MLWIGTALMLVASTLALMAIIFATRPARDLGPLSNDWIARHRVDGSLDGILHADGRDLLGYPFDSRKR